MQRCAFHFSFHLFLIHINFAKTLTPFPYLCIVTTQLSNSKTHKHHVKTIIKRPQQPRHPQRLLRQQPHRNLSIVSNISPSRPWRGEGNFVTLQQNKGTLEASLVLMSIHHIVDRLVKERKKSNQAFGRRLTFMS